MWNLSGYDSEAVGFDSVAVKKTEDASTGTQTTEFFEAAVATQTVAYKDGSSMTSPTEDLTTKDVKYSAANLNAFLQRVMPGMLEQLDENKENAYESSESDEDNEILTAKLVQELKVREVQGSGDQALSVLDLSWSNTGNSLAVSLGQKQHENWCTDNGLIRFYTVKVSAGDKLVHSMDINEKNCVSVLKYHPSVAALFVYGTVTGEIVICDLRNNDELQMTSPSGTHGSKRVTALSWLESTTAETFFAIHINNTGKRRASTDRILVSSGSDGTIVAWHVNADNKTFEAIVTYSVNGARKMAAPDISCFDFINTFPLRPTGDKISNDIFVVGTNVGNLFLCNIKNAQSAAHSGHVDPVSDVLESHATCILAVTFHQDKPGVFITLSIDSELRIYNVKQASPLKIISLDYHVSCVGWLPYNPWLAVVGTEAEMRLCDVACGREVHVDGLKGTGGVCKLAVNQIGGCRVAAGDSEGCVKIWDLPRCSHTPGDDLDI
ncbi:cytoplasmic dynein 2 intermediate chain 2 [Bombyx mori]|uniref:WD repeat-containing protein 34-like n=1 Tax=Bombyx mori TaxID=7091 RepID=A0A8R1WLW3_BOMMO|nr:cytoplasmic dynein 2 intermediate chain 2 [Bombyx mori]